MNELTKTGQQHGTPDTTRRKPPLTIQQEAAITTVLDSVAAATTGEPTHIILEAVAGAGSLCILVCMNKDAQAREDGHVGGHD